jgi:hypothetical protein
MLNYGYGVLYSLVEKACIYAGLDPFVGFLHTDNYVKKSLVFDLLEPYRPPLLAAEPASGSDPGRSALATAGRLPSRQSLPEWVGTRSGAVAVFFRRMASVGGEAARECPADADCAVTAQRTLGDLRSRRVAWSPDRATTEGESVRIDLSPL